MEVASAAEVGGLRDPVRGLHIYEGTLLFVTSFCFTYGCYPYKRECGWDNGKRPSSKPAGSSIASAADSFRAASAVSRSPAITSQLPCRKLTYREEGVRLAQKMQAGPCMPAEIQR